MSKEVDLPVRIVPVVGSGYKRPPIPGHPGNGVAYYNGPLISSVQVYTLFWGSVWQSTLSALAAQINQFFQYIVTSPLIDQLSEYSLPSYPIQHGVFAGTKTIASPDPPPTVTDADIQTFVMQNKSHPPLDGHLYFVFFPNGVTVIMNGGASCAAFCGYHGIIATGPPYAVIPYPACVGCLSSLGTFNAITAVCSHELCEAITDPIPPSGWYGQVGTEQGEIGDFCVQNLKSLGGYTVQKMWSNTALSCV